MSTEKEVTIRITSLCDPSVGLPQITVNIEPAVFLDDMDRDDFRRELQTAFTYVMDSPYVVFSDEEQNDPEPFD